MKIVILEADTLGRDMDLSMFNQLGEVVIYPLSTLEQVPERVNDADVVLMNKLPMNEQTLKDAKNLKLIAVTATGTNIVDFDYVNQRGIKVCNVAGYSTDTVAQHTFALLFYVMEKMHYYDSYVKSGEYSKSPMFTHIDQPFMELAGKTWGIIGLGAIGRKVATIAKAFGCHVIYYSTSGKNNNSEYERVEFETLLEKSDILSIHAPLTPETTHLLNRVAFEQMKENAIVINVGRGPIIVDEDLAYALEHNLIGGAGLDVVTTEPIQENNPLLAMKDSNKLVITPHIAWASNEARCRLVNEVYANVESFSKGIERNLV